MHSAQLKLLTFLWSLAVVFSFNSSFRWITFISSEYSNLAVLALASAFLFKPYSRLLLTGTIGALLYTFVHDLPAIPNHRNILVLSSILLCIALRSVHSATRAICTLRWITLVVYAFATLAKLNYAYLDPQTSCASSFFSQALELHGIDPKWVARSLIDSSLTGWWSLASEIIVMLLLIAPRTRRVGVILGVAFHLILATHYTKYFANFSATMFVLLLSWLDEPSCKRLFYEKLSYWRHAFAIGAVLLCGLSCATAFGYLTISDFSVVRYVIWSAYGWYVLYAICCVVSNSSEGLSLANPYWSIVAIAIMEGLCPYLGVKNRGAFSMYSNLRIEPQFSNHLFMPASPDPLGYMTDTTTIISAHAANPQDASTIQKATYPYLAVCSYLDGKSEYLTSGPVTIHFSRHGQEFSAVTGGALPSDCPPVLARKLLLMGPVGPGSDRVCVW